MLEVLPGAPEGVLAYKVVGDITADDFTKILNPAADEVIKKHDGLRAVIVLGPEWTGLTAGGLWEDLKSGLSKLTKWKRCAVVTDREWIERATKAFGGMSPGEVKLFEPHHLDDAMKWAAATA